MMSMSMGFGMILNMIFWIFIVGIVIYGVLSLFMKAFERKEDPALKILRERYAQGEISEQELEEKSQYLKKK